MGGKTIALLLLGLALCLPGAEVALAGGGGRARYEQARVREGARTAKRAMNEQRAQMRRGGARGRRGRRGRASDPFLRLRSEISGTRATEETAGNRAERRAARRGRAREERRRGRSELATRLAESARSAQIETRGRTEEVRAPELKSIEAAPEGKALTRGPERKALTRGPERKALTRGPERKAIERAPERLAIEAAPTPKALTAGPERKVIEAAPERRAIEAPRSSTHEAPAEHVASETAPESAAAHAEPAARSPRAQRRASKREIRQNLRQAAQDARDLIEVGEIHEAARVIGAAGRSDLGFRDRQTLRRARNDVLHAAYSMANRRSRAGDIEGTVDALQAVSELSRTGTLGTLPLIKAWFTEDIGFLNINNRVFDNAMDLSIHSRKSGDLETAMEQLDFAGELRPGHRRIKFNAKRLYKASFDMAGKLAGTGDAEQTYLAMGLAEHAASAAGYSDYKVAQDLNKSLIQNAKRLQSARQHDEAAEMLVRAELIQNESGMHVPYRLRKTQRNLGRELGRRMSGARAHMAEELAQAEAEANAPVAHQGEVASGERGAEPGAE